MITLKLAREVYSFARRETRKLESSLDDALSSYYSGHTDLEQAMDNVRVLAAEIKVQREIAQEDYNRMRDVGYRDQCIEIINGWNAEGTDKYIRDCEACGGIGYWREKIPATTFLIDDFQAWQLDQE